MVTSRCVPQQTAQIFSPLAGQKRAVLRFSQIGQFNRLPRDCSETGNLIATQQDTTGWSEKQNARPGREGRTFTP